MPRVTFPKIASQQHLEATGVRVATGSKSVLCRVDAVDKKIAREVVAIHKALQKADIASGEWKWINANVRDRYLDALSKEDIGGVAQILVNMFRTDAIYGLISSDYAMTKTEDGRRALENHILLDLDAWREFTDQDDRDIAWLDMPRVGNPYGAQFGKTLVSVDNARHDYFALRLLRLAERLRKPRPHILEIGGGYGGLCYQMFRRTKNLCFIDCDLPESLYLTYYFLRRATNKKIIWAFDKPLVKKDFSADIILVPAQRKELVTGLIDIAFNCHSLSEMAKLDVDDYMAFIHRLKPAYFLHQNSNYLLYPKGIRHIEVLSRDYSLDPALYKEVYRAISPWQGGGGRYREFFYRRVDVCA